MVNPKKFWEKRYDEFGRLSTGFTDEVLYVYDDNLRWNTFLRVVDPKKGQKILDAGCNHGPWSVRLAKMGLEVTGFDISSKAISEAKRIAKNEEVKIKFSAEKAENIKFEKGEFDVIVSVTMMQHIMEDKLFLKTLKNFHNCLSKEGKLVLIESATTRPRKEKLSYKRERTFKKQVELCKKAGFKLVETRGIDFFSDKFYWASEVLPLPKAVKRTPQKIMLAILYTPDLALSRMQFLTKHADLKLMVFKK